MVLVINENEHHILDQFVMIFTSQLINFNIQLAEILKCTSIKCLQKQSSNVPSYNSFTRCLHLFDKNFR